MESDEGSEEEEKEEEEGEKEPIGVKEFEQELDNSASIAKLPSRKSKDQEEKRENKYNFTDHCGFEEIIDWRELNKERKLISLFLILSFFVTIL